MKVVLFALTGFGNKVLDALKEEGCEIPFLFTRKEKGPYPYYVEENITVFASRQGIRVFEDFTWDEAREVISRFKPDLILVSTFHRIIPNDILNMAEYAINLHPSLLPKYKGPTPIAWVLYNKEKETGVTAHLLSEEVDGGDVAVQRSIAILPGDDESALRKKLSILAAEVAKEVVIKISNSNITFIEQNNELSTYFPKFSAVNKI